MKTINKQIKINHRICFLNGEQSKHEISSVRYRLCTCLMPEKQAETSKGLCRSLFFCTQQRSLLGACEMSLISTWKETKQAGLLYHLPIKTMFCLEYNTARGKLSYSVFNSRTRRRWTATFCCNCLTAGFVETSSFGDLQVSGTFQTAYLVIFILFTSLSGKWWKQKCEVVLKSSSAWFDNISH